MRIIYRMVEWEEVEVGDRIIVSDTVHQITGLTQNSDVGTKWVWTTDAKGEPHGYVCGKVLCLVIPPLFEEPRCDYTMEIDDERVAR
jgi:hypothetical protein